MARGATVKITAHDKVKLWQLGEELRVGTITPEQYLKRLRGLSRGRRPVDGRSKK